MPIAHAPHLLPYKPPYRPELVHRHLERAIRDDHGLPVVAPSLLVTRRRHQAIATAAVAAAIAAAAAAATASTATPASSLPVALMPWSRPPLWPTLMVTVAPSWLLPA